MTDETPIEGLLKHMMQDVVKAEAENERRRTALLQRVSGAIRTVLAENERLRAALRDCAQIADDAIHACMTDEERDIATTIRNLILSRYPESRKALKGEEEK